MKSVIHTKSLSHSFGEKNVLNNISFEIEEGEIFGLLGPSGAGKTTLINILTGQLGCQSGEVKLFGKAQEGLAEARKTPVSKLSKGMRNRLSFARAMLRSPRLLFLDEPISGLLQRKPE